MSIQSRSNDRQVEGTGSAQSFDGTSHAEYLRARSDLKRVPSARLLRKILELAEVLSGLRPTAPPRPIMGNAIGQRRGRNRRAGSELGVPVEANLSPEDRRRPSRKDEGHFVGKPESLVGRQERPLALLLGSDHVKEER